MTQAVLEGVAFAMRDCLRGAARRPARTLHAADAIGGGARSRLWLTIIANVLDLPLHRLADSEVGGAFGRRALGRIAATGEPATAVCTPPKRIGDASSRARPRAMPMPRAYARYRNLYPAIKEATR